MRLDEVSGGLVFLGCGCCGIRGPVPTFGRIWVTVLRPCAGHNARFAEPLLLVVDEDVTRSATAVSVMPSNGQRPVGTIAAMERVNERPILDRSS